MESIFTVEGSFELPGLGCVIAGFLPCDADVSIRIGDTLMLQRPDGHAIELTVRGFPMVNFGRRANHIHFSIQLPIGVSPNAVPVGTKVFLKANSPK